MRMRSRAGFTLVEMLVALTVFALLAGAGVGVMGYAVQSQDAVRLNADRLGDFQRTRGLLKADLSQAALRRTRGADGRLATRTFHGTLLEPGSPLMAFTRHGWDNPDAAARASLQYVEYRLVDGRLERRARPALDGAPLGEPQVLIEGVSDLAIAFRYRGQWIETWAAAPIDSLPEAVRLEMTVEGLGRVSQVFLAPGAGR